MLQRILASRFAGTLLIALAALTVAAGVYGYIQNGRADRATTLAESRLETVKSQSALIRQRDILIASQNDGIAKLAAAATAGREVYLTTYAKADERARDHDDHAAELLALQGRFTDELAECRAAKTLLKKELVK